MCAIVARHVCAKSLLVRQESFCVPRVLLHVVLTMSVSRIFLLQLVYAKCLLVAKSLRRLRRVSSRITCAQRVFWLQNDCVLQYFAAIIVRTMCARRGSRTPLRRQVVCVWVVGVCVLNVCACIIGLVLLKEPYEISLCLFSIGPVVYVCVYGNEYVYMHIYIYAYVCTYAWVYVYAHIYTYVYIYIRIYIHVWIYAYWNSFTILASVCFRFKHSITSATVGEETRVRGFTKNLWWKSDSMRSLPICYIYVNTNIHLYICIHIQIHLYICICIQWWEWYLRAIVLQHPLHILFFLHILCVDE